MNHKVITLYNFNGDVALLDPSIYKKIVYILNLLAPFLSLWYYARYIVHPVNREHGNNESY